MSKSTDFDQLVHTLLDRRDRASMDALWQAVFEEYELHFIASGDAAQDAPRPCVTRTQDRTFVLAFTDRDRARGYAGEHGLLDESGAAPIVSVRPAGLQEYLTGLLEEDIFGLLFNPGPGAFYTPLTNVAPLHKRFIEGESEEISTDFDAVVEAARLEGTQEASERMWKALFEVPDWVFVAEAKDSDVPTFMFVGEQPAIMVFTHREKAHAWAKRHEMVDADGAANLLEVPAGNAAHWIASLPAEDFAGAVFNDGVNGFFLPVDQLASLAAQHAPAPAPQADQQKDQTDVS